VRETVEAQSAVIEHVTTNTRVDVVAEHGKTCEIVWGDAKRGFVPRGLLGERTLTLKETKGILDYPHPELQNHRRSQRLVPRRNGQIAWHDR
jgi:hypothetical protein